MDSPHSRTEVNSPSLDRFVGEIISHSLDELPRDIHDFPDFCCLVIVLLSWEEELGGARARTTIVLLMSSRICWWKAEANRTAFRRERGRKDGDGSG